METTTGLNRLEKVMALLNEVEKEISLLLLDQTKADFEYSQAMMERNDIEHLVENLDTDELSESDALKIIKETNRVRNERREAKQFKELMERQNKTLTQIMAFSKEFRNETLKRASAMKTNYSFRTMEIAELYKDVKQVKLPIHKTQMKTEHLYTEDADKVVQKLTGGRSLTGGHQLSNNNLHYISMVSNNDWVLKVDKNTVLRKRKLRELIDFLVSHDIHSVAIGKKLCHNIQSIVFNQPEETKDSMVSWYEKATAYWQKQKTLI